MFLQEWQTRVTLGELGDPFQAVFLSIFISNLVDWGGVRFSLLWSYYDTVLRCFDASRLNMPN